MKQGSYPRLIPRWNVLVFHADTSRLCNLGDLSREQGLRTDILLLKLVVPLASNSTVLFVNGPYETW